jgi:hypothetical protein
MNADFASLLRCPFTGSSLKLDAFEKNGDRVRFGVLAGQGGEFPIVAGIPILLSNQQPVVSLLKKGAMRTAIATAAVGSRYVGTLDTVLKTHPLLNKFRRFTKPRDERRKREWLERAADLLAPANGEQLRSRQLYEFGFLRCGSPSNEAFHYNYCRFAMPGYFVGLSFLEAIGTQQGYVLDHSCGSGHLSWAMQRACSPAQVVGCDVSFLSLYIAAETMAPQATYVCAEVAQLPFRDGVFSAVFNSDAFNNFSGKLVAFHEMVRVAGPDAPIVLVWLRNSLHEHLYGKPVSAEAYQGIVAPFAHRLYSDELVLRRFIGQIADGGDNPEKEPTFSMWVSKGSNTPPASSQLGQASIPFERLAVNPIYKPKAAGVWERNFPSKFFANEDSDKKFYYPEQFTLTAEQEKALENGQTGVLQDLLRTGVIVGRPERFA